MEDSPSPSKKRCYERTYTTDTFGAHHSGLNIPVLNHHLLNHTVVENPPTYCRNNESDIKGYLGSVPYAFMPPSFISPSVPSFSFQNNKQVHKTGVDNEPVQIKTPATFSILNNYPLHELALTSIGEKFLTLELEQVQELHRLSFESPISHIYNPLEYAIEPHANFIKQYCTGQKDVLFLGMNPGPFGMVQTAVPFGEVSLVKEWLQVSGQVNRPSNEHPKRPVLGFTCSRSEVSGSRFWGYFKARCGSPDRFFQHCYVHNMCPLVFMNDKGKNLTPPDIQVTLRNQLNEICDKYLCKIVELLNVKIVVGIGNFAQKRAMKALKHLNSVEVKVIMHPSPANPAANKGWQGIVEKQLDSIGVSKYL